MEYQTRDDGVPGRGILRTRGLLVVRIETIESVYLQLIKASVDTQPSFTLRECELKI